MVWADCGSVFTMGIKYMYKEAKWSTKQQQETKTSTKLAMRMMKYKGMKLENLNGVRENSGLAQGRTHAFMLTQPLGVGKIAANQATVAGSTELGISPISLYKPVGPRQFWLQVSSFNSQFHVCEATNRYFSLYRLMSDTTNHPNLAWSVVEIQARPLGYIKPPSKGWIQWQGTSDLVATHWLWRTWKAAWMVW